MLADKYFESCLMRSYHFWSGLQYFRIFIEVNFMLSYRVRLEDFLWHKLSGVIDCLVSITLFEIYTLYEHIYMYFCESDKKDNLKITEFSSIVCWTFWVLPKLKIHLVAIQNIFERILESLNIVAFTKVNWCFPNCSPTLDFDLIFT